MAQSWIRLRGVREHNLANLQLNIPHGQLVVVTGVSGSGKSSLAFDVVAREGQRRFMETLPSFSRQLLGGWKRPEVDQIEGLMPVITIGQKTTSGNARSTVGTLSDGSDLLRLLFARIGKGPADLALTRSLFSFNTPQGACPHCQGLGVEERISVDKLVADPNLTLREGALAPTLPTGYIMYSQVTVEVLNMVCEAHGFTVDIPWNELNEEQQNVVLNGSTQLKVPYGKHSIESRLKWTGIVAKPREEGHYKGLMPIMSDILRRDRNPNILRYAESVTCSACLGKRLKPEALSVTVQKKNIAELSSLEGSELRQWWLNQNWDAATAPIAEAIGKPLLRLLNWLEKLGLGYLSLDRASDTLSGGESQRIRLINQISAELSDVLYVLDEPSIGLHPKDNAALLEVLQTLVNRGNTVLIVEHDATTIKQADWIVDLGPGAGEAGGQLLFNGPFQSFLEERQLAGKSPTFDVLRTSNSELANAKLSHLQPIELRHIQTHNLQDISVHFYPKAFNVVTGVAGAGKSSLVKHALLQRAEQAMNESSSPGKAGLSAFDYLLSIDQSPIGRTPRSNPATYTGLADRIRDVFAQTEQAKASGFKKSRFSFNTKGGRCETCQGAGLISVGMHFLGNVNSICGTCLGMRFNKETLNIQFRDHSIAEVFELSVAEALTVFEGLPKLCQPLQMLQDVGLSYLRLGQASSTLSGGEAQRVKLAAELHHRKGKSGLYLLDEPTVGLHPADVQVLLKALRSLVEQGHTIVCVEHDDTVIRQADWVIDLGPGGGREGGQLMIQGTPAEVAQSKQSLTGAALRGKWSSIPPIPEKTTSTMALELEGVSTHLLQSVSVAFPKNQLSVVTGVSGSGKSSLVFDTLFAESNSRFTESLTTYQRSRLKQANRAELTGSRGLGPVVAIGRKFLVGSERSTVGTVSGINDHLRLLYSRLAQQQGFSFSAQQFSFNHQSGACTTCEGLGVTLQGNPEALVAHPEKSVLDGAISGNRIANYYGNPDGQFIAILKAVGLSENLGLDRPWNALEPAVRNLVLNGTGEQIWETTWRFKTATREGEQAVKAAWLGFSGYVEDEFRRKHQNKNIQTLTELLHPVSCTLCGGARLQTERLAIKWQGRSIADWSALPIDDIRPELAKAQAAEKQAILKEILQEILPPVQQQLQLIQALGLGYLSLNRSSPSLSGGEGQRLRLAGQLAAQLHGVTYVLDEPTVGLHDDNTQQLLEVLRLLINRGNTVVVVEHDTTVIQAADYLVEMGPGSGIEGGHIVAAGAPQKVLQHPDSITGPLLIEAATLTFPPRNLQPEAFGVQGAFANNLQDLDATFTAGGLIAVAGPSGSGKTSLIREVLWPSIKAGRPRGCRNSFGLSLFDAVGWIDQRPLSGTESSTPATFTGLMDRLRAAYSMLPEAREQGLKKSAFSYLHKEGRCPECNGFGRIKSALDFLSDVWVACESCKGKRYRKAVLNVKLNGLSIGDCLHLTVSEALVALKELPKARPALEALHQLGLGHLKLGHPGNALSGGEAQRLKLAKELAQPTKGRKLFLLDEPSTGLHLRDLKMLAKVLHELTVQGHTVLYIEHHPKLIAMADQVINIGPGSGVQGGRLV